jgi:hypothetical protein
MLNTAEFADRTAQPTEIEHFHAPNLLMHWIDVCDEPVAQTVQDVRTVAKNSLAHRDHLVAIWVEQSETPS